MGILIMRVASFHKCHCSHFLHQCCPTWAPMLSNSYTIAIHFHCCCFVAGKYPTIISQSGGTLTLPFTRNPLLLIFRQPYRVFLKVFCLKVRSPFQVIILNIPLLRAYINIMWTPPVSLYFCQIKEKQSLFSHFLLKTFGGKQKNPYLCIRFWERTLLQNSY